MSALPYETAKVLTDIRVEDGLVVLRTRGNGPAIETFYSAEQARAMARFLDEMADEVAAAVPVEEKQG